MAEWPPPGIAWYYHDDWTAIALGDCLEVLPLLAPGSVDMVLTDPPYGVNIASWDKQAPYDILPALLEISHGAVLWFGASVTLRNDLIAFIEPPQRVIVWHVRFSLAQTAAHGMYYRWHPIYGWRLPKKHTGPACDVLSIAQHGHNGWDHPGTKPLPLIHLLTGFCQPGSIILDPFMGSGTTLRAAKDRGRRAIGIELEERYCEVAANRLRQEVLPLDLPRPRAPEQLVMTS